MTNFWLIENHAGRDYAQARAQHAITPEQLEAFSRIESTPTTIARVAGDVAEIPIVGVLTRGRDRFAWSYGYANTSYSDILAALAEAERSDAIKRIVLRVDSPGGQVAGLFDVLDALQAAKKPITAVCDLAASAAYGIAASADRIEATGRAASFGSIGVATSFAFWKSEELIELTNTDSPDKRPDVRTEAGKAVVVKQLDDIAALFIDSIARGRGVRADAVRKGYGRGAMMLAAAAKRAGMIDAVRGPFAGATAAATASAPKGLDAVFAEPAPGAASKHAREVLLPLIRPASHAPAVQDIGDRIVSLVPSTSARR